MLIVRVKGRVMSLNAICCALFQTVKLHEKLGKPIPEVLSAEAQDKDKKKEGTVKAQTPKPSFRNNQRRNRKPSAPKITFIGGTTLNTSTGETATSTDAPETPDAESAVATPDEGEKKAETPCSEEGKEPKLVGKLQLIEGLFLFFICFNFST